MKILHVIYSFTTGGTETMLVDIINKQVETEDVTLIIINDFIDKELVESIDKRAKIIYLRRKPGSKSVIPFIKLNWFIWKIRPDAIHAHYLSIFKVILPVFDYKLFVTIHALGFNLTNAKRAKCIFAISEAVKEDIVSRGDYNVAVVSNGICLEKIKHRSNMYMNDRIFKIVQVANLRGKKGQDILIDAIALLKEKGIENVCVDFIGTGPTELALKEQAYKKGIAEKINFLGLKNRTFIYSHLKEYDLMCHPAREEGFGLAVAEGIAAKLPVLVSDEGGPYEIINKGEFGYTFKMEDSKDCADKIEYLLNNYKEAQTKTENAFKHVEKNYSVDRMVKEYIESFKK